MNAEAAQFASEPLYRRLAGGIAREVAGIATLAARYPQGLKAATLQPRVSETSFDAPVILVHGYMHNRSGFAAMGVALRRRGFEWVHALNYNPLGHSVPSLGAKLAQRVDEVLEITGAEQVHLVGHSLGGLVIRDFVQRLGGDKLTRRAVTIGSPNRGTLTAYAAFGQAGRDMRPGSAYLKELNSRRMDECDCEFTAIYSDLDALIIPAHSAKLAPASNVRNAYIGSVGHGSLLLDPNTIRKVADELSIGAQIASVTAIR